ncbi:TPM domain-containing protein [Winogradskyella sp. UBA3174]|uniref:TPM domain-containing protein n=1 Tax=Winogradskyella sp. UBA3174 TaxID=1947785 RepID=UPI0025F8271A|nr:TPM domain-containing protein [Winogradskyella sp. UBA3174]|tara:strand:+ start:24933 stop:25178 length:246 start_codon:yes stop_codon:yes gene_type:complete
MQRILDKLGEFGTAEKNNGLTIVLCSPCKQIGIATGTGTELIMTNEICKEVICKKITPEFKNREFYTGIKNGVNELIEKWK